METKTKPSKNRLILIIVAAALALAFILGLAGVSLAGEAEGASTEQGRDRLAGVLITHEWLDTFDAQAYFEANGITGEISPEDAAKYQNRIYGAPVTDGERERYDFGVEGMQYMSITTDGEQGACTVMYGDDGISGNNTAYASTDEGESISLDATVYLAADAQNSDRFTFYVNPVYQQPDGQVYVLSGNGTSMGGDLTEGSAFTQKLNETYEAEAGGERDAWSAEINIRFELMFVPESITVDMFNESGALIETHSYAPDAVPGKLTAARDAAYMIISTLRHNEKGEANIKRELYQPPVYETDSSYATTYAAREDGVITGRSIEIEW